MESPQRVSSMNDRESCFAPVAMENMDLKKLKPDLGIQVRSLSNNAG